MHRLAVLFLTLAGAACAPYLAHAEAPRYAATSRTAKYAVKISAEEPDDVDVLKGDVRTELSPVEGGFTLVATGALESSQWAGGTTRASNLGSRLTHLGFGQPGISSGLKINAWGIPVTGPADRKTASNADRTPTASAADIKQPIFMLGDLNRLVDVPLSPDGVSSWETDRDCAIPIRSSNARSATRTATRTALLPAHEHASFRLGDTLDGRSSLTGRYEVKTVQLINGAPRVQVSLDGFAVFDDTVGLVHSIDLKGTLFTTSVAGTEKTPLTISVRRLQRPLAPPKDFGPKLSDEERDQLINELDPRDHAHRAEAIRRLQAVTADDHCSEVSEALVGCLSDPDLFIRWGAVDALKVWADADAILPLCNVSLAEPEHAVRWATLTCLGVLRDPRSAAPLAARLDSPDRDFAVDAIEKLGPPAEAPVIPYLRNPEWTVRLSAVKVLAQIGGRASLRPLQLTGANDENGIVRMAVTDALKSIYGRLQSQRLLR